MSWEYQTTVGPIDKDNSFVRYDNSVLIFGYCFTVIWSPYQLGYSNKICKTSGTNLDTATWTLWLPPGRNSFDLNSIFSWWKCRNLVVLKNLLNGAIDCLDLLWAISQEAPAPSQFSAKGFNRQTTLLTIDSRGYWGLIVICITSHRLLWSIDSFFKKRSEWFCERLVALILSCDIGGCL